MADEEIQSPAAADEPAVSAEALPVPAPEDDLQEKLDAMNDRYLRMLAETENFKKRMARERTEERAYAAQDAVLAILPIADSLERSLQAVSAVAATDLDPAFGKLFKGVELTMRQFEGALRGLGVETIEAPLGKVFDPAFHQALLQEPDAGHEEGAILEVLQKGYKLGERVLRPSMVKVSHKP
ncbi:MAG: nucleotide exchange factor GrpE [candidate division FCPU426 bacterium]